MHSLELRICHTCASKIISLNTGVQLKEFVFRNIKYYCMLNALRITTICSIYQINIRESLLPLSIAILPFMHLLLIQYIKVLKTILPNIMPIYYHVKSDILGAGEKDVFTNSDIHHRHTGKNLLKLELHFLALNLLRWADYLKSHGMFCS